MCSAALPCSHPIWSYNVMQSSDNYIKTASFTCKAAVFSQNQNTSPKSDCAKGIFQFHHSLAYASTLFTEGETASKDKQVGL